MKKRKHLLFSSFLLLTLLFLSGCVQTKNGVPTGEGIVYNFFVAPMGNIIKFFAVEHGLGFGVGIIIVTLMVRLLILPLGIYQSWKMTYQAEKMRYLKPILDPIQERMRNADTQAEQLAAQQEYFATQKQYGVSIFGGFGCLPIVIQMPFFTGLFWAARYTEGISEATFFGIDLGSRSLILVAIAGILYFIQSLFMQTGQNMDEAQKKQMRTTMLLNPIMIVFFSWSSPAGVTLYWVVGGLFGIIQQLLTTFIIKPRIHAQIEEEFAKNPPKAPSTSQPKDVTPVSQGAIQESSSKKKRNAGKQHSRS